MSDTFTITHTITHTFRAGWGVDVLPIFDDETDAVTEIEVSVVRIAEDTVVMHGDVPCVRGEGYDIPVSNFDDTGDLWADDTHDLRTRWFATEAEARAHARSVQATWDSPAPWVSFVAM
jgi:hypothetical protein